MRERYTNQPIIAADWPPKVGEDFFGRLELIEAQKDMLQRSSPWYMLRGQVDQIATLPGCSEVALQDILQPKGSLSIRVVVDGPPGIGKTTLCRKLLSMWANGDATLTREQYKLVLYCPLRNSKIAQATTLADLFLYQRHEVPELAEKFQRMNGKGLLIIFDGWDELNVECRLSTLAARIICKQQLDECSVLVTSRTYATSSLLEITTDAPLTRHVQIIGFSVDEIATVIRGTLEDTTLAENLINDIQVQNDVQSLCYIPLVCSMVILVYHQSGHLPKTITELYQKFILQTIKRHIKKNYSDMEPRHIHDIDCLPSFLAEPLQEICQFAYLSLKNESNKATFSLSQLQQSLDVAIKEDYLGLMTTAAAYDEEVHYFLHLTIQEFLAAWWIAKHERKAEEVFKEHFGNDHFRMCLRFVAGLTHLEHECYRQYFNKPLDLQCKKKPLFGFEAFKRSWFYKNPEIIYDTLSSAGIPPEYFEELPILLFQLVYESQNKKLCQILAESIKSQSLRIHENGFPLFNTLCLGYFLANSDVTWNHLSIVIINDQQLSVLATGLANCLPLNYCKRLEIKVNHLTEATVQSLSLLFQQSFISNMEECYCELFAGKYNFLHVLLPFFKLQNLKILHVKMISCKLDSTYNSDECSEVVKQLEINSSLEELMLNLYENDENFHYIFTSIIEGANKNRTIKSFTFNVSPFLPLSSTSVVNLLKNTKLQALGLFGLKITSPSTIEVCARLNALDSVIIDCLLPSYIEGLSSLILPYPRPLSLLLESHPGLQQLHLPLDTRENCIELFTILQHNDTLKGLRVELYLKDETFTSDINTCLQDMLTHNHTLRYLEIDAPDDLIPSSFFCFLTNGLIDNTGLHELSIPRLPLFTDDTHAKSLLNVISQKELLTEIQLNMTFGQSYCVGSGNREAHASLFYEQMLPAVTNMLKTHVTLRLFKMEFHDFSGVYYKANWKQLVNNFYEVIFCHPSIEYIELKFVCPFVSMPASIQFDDISSIKKHDEEQKPLLMKLKPLRRSSVVILLEKITAVM